MEGLNALENAATEIRFGDNFTFAGAGKVNKTLNKVDDALGKNVAKVEGANTKVNATLQNIIDNGYLKTIKKSGDYRLYMNIEEKIKK